MKAYFDSGLITKLYCLEADSAAAVRLLRGWPPGQPFTSLHALEVENALRLKAWRGELTADELALGLRAFAADQAAGLWRTAPLEWPDIWAEARRLSAAVTMGTGSRSLDLLHVATARLLETDRFHSGDARQLAAAAEAGLQIVRFGSE